METKELKISVPEGYKIDEENSTFECIKFKKIETPLQTIELKLGTKNYIFTKVDDFYICKTQVTQQLWEDIMKNNPSHFKGTCNPVESVSYNDCIKFIEKLKEITGLNFDLPTGKQWTKAAGNVDSQNIDDIAWYYKNSDNKTHAVGQKKPNNYGLYDMLGNVWEWTKDTSRSCLGGSFHSSAWYFRVVNSICFNNCSPSSHFSYVGFRLVINM